MTTTPEYPALRPDLELMTQASPGKPDRAVLRDPASSLVVEFSDKEAFLCRQLDGRTPYAEVSRRFLAAFGLELREEHYEAFLRQLEDRGLLRGYIPEQGDRWARMTRLPVAADRWCERLERWWGWTFSTPAFAGWVLLWVGALVVVGGALPTIWYQLTHLIDSIRNAALNGGLSFDLVYRLVLLLVVIPFLRELAKGTRCQHYGVRVPEFRYTWFMHFLPRCAADLSVLHRLTRPERLRVASAGMLFEWVLFAVALLASEVFRANPVLQDLAFSTALAAGIGGLFNAVPLGNQDGSLLFAVAQEIPELRERAVTLSRAWWMRHTPPEALAPDRRRLFLLYGLLADLYSAALNVAVFLLLGYLLASWYGGLGALLFLVLLALRFEDELRSLVRVLDPFHPKSKPIMAKSKSSRPWLFWLIAAAVVLLLCFLPYPLEYSGEFRIQPGARVDIRSAVQAQIAEIPLAEGAQVHAGDVMIRLDTRDVTRLLEEARLQLKTEQQRLQLMNAGARPESVAEAEQKVRLAETSLAHSESALKRATELHAKEHISDQDFESVTRQRDVERETAELARRELAVIKSGSRAEEIDMQKSVIAGIELDITHLEEDLKRTTLTSPIDGQITTFYMAGREGQRVNVGDVVATVEDSRRAVARIALPEEYVGDLAVGARVRMRPWSFAGRIFEGKIQAILPVVVEKSDDQMKEAHQQQESGMVRNVGTPGELVVPVLAEFDNPDGLLKTEMTGYAKIDAGWKPLGYALFHPVIRFLRVQVWSWIP